MAAKVDDFNGGLTTHYKITGTLEEVKTAVESILRSFHPYGYGTHFSEPVEDEREPGVWFASGSRYNSCD